ncbi:MAG: hypothetical protein ACPLRW_06645 [Moorellales bacterium]
MASGMVEAQGAAAPVFGWGVCLCADDVDYEALAGAVGVDPDQLRDWSWVYAEAMATFLERVCAQAGYLRWTDHCDPEEDRPVYYVYCPAYLPWEAPAGVSRLSPELVRKDLERLLSPILSAPGTLVPYELYAVALC